MRYSENSFQNFKSCSVRWSYSSIGIRSRQYLVGRKSALHASSKSIDMRVLFFLLCSTVLIAADDSILFNAINTLTFREGKLSTAKRGAPVQQLTCVGGDACDKFKPKVVQCKNVGTNDRGEVQWECQAEMEKLYRLGTTDVSCEGYRYSGDQLVLVGSCGLEYTLHLTELGKQHYMKQQKQEVPRHHHPLIRPRVLADQKADKCFIPFRIFSPFFSSSFYSLYTVVYHLSIVHVHYTCNYSGQFVSDA